MPHPQARRARADELSVLLGAEAVEGHALGIDEHRGVNVAFEALFTTAVLSPLDDDVAPA